MRGSRGAPPRRRTPAPRGLRHTSGWSTHLSREGHCDWYEKTKVKYYAGNALAQIKNPHVTDAVLREAENARNDGQERYKVTDPGWI